MPCLQCANYLRVYRTTLVTSHSPHSVTLWPYSRNTRAMTKEQHSRRCWRQATAMTHVRGETKWTESTSDVTSKPITLQALWETRSVGGGQGVRGGAYIIQSPVIQCAPPVCRPGRVSHHRTFFLPTLIPRTSLPDIQLAAANDAPEHPR
ncbi:hypothetical protein BC629DRAFT_870726 [Irpex lacteus]|nr:hypothetical protein BC629DRAFT_870726 [Irpex lacteus]